MLVVCAAVIEREDKILIAQREEGDRAEFKWEFPGGKIEEGESPEECIVREIREELDMDIEVVELFDVIYHKYPEKNILLIVYKCNHRNGLPKALECNDFTWINREELVRYNFTNADRKIVEKLLKSL